MDADVGNPDRSTATFAQRGPASCRCSAACVRVADGGWIVGLHADCRFVADACLGWRHLHAMVLYLARIAAADIGAGNDGADDPQSQARLPPHRLAAGFLGWDQRCRCRLLVGIPRGKSNLHRQRLERSSLHRVLPARGGRVRDVLSRSGRIIRAATGVAGHFHSRARIVRHAVGVSAGAGVADTFDS